MEYLSYLSFSIKIGVQGNYQSLLAHDYIYIHRTQW